MQMGSFLGDTNEDSFDAQIGSRTSNGKQNSIRKEDQNFLCLTKSYRGSRQRNRDGAGVTRDPAAKLKNVRLSLRLDSDLVHCERGLQRNWSQKLLPMV